MPSSWLRPDDVTMTSSPRRGRDASRSRDVSGCSSGRSSRRTRGTRSGARTSQRRWPVSRRPAAPVYWRSSAADDGVGAHRDNSSTRSSPNPGETAGSTSATSSSIWRTRARLKWLMTWTGQQQDQLMRLGRRNAWYSCSRRWMRWWVVRRRRSTVDQTHYHDLPQTLVVATSGDWKSRTSHSYNELS